MAYQNLQADFYLEGNLACCLKQIVQCLSSSNPGLGDYDKRRARWHTQHEQLQQRLRVSEAAAEAAAETSSKAVNSRLVCKALREVLPADVIYVDETVIYGTVVQQHLLWNRPQSYFHVPSGLGQGFGTSLGIKLAARDRTVVLLTGDGSLLYNPVLPALTTAQTYGLNLLVVVFNNGGYVSMKRNHLNYYPKGIAKQTETYHGVTIRGPDYDQLAPLFGGFGARVDEASDLRNALSRSLAALQEGRMAIVNILSA